MFVPPPSEANGTQGFAPRVYKTPWFPLQLATIVNWFTLDPVCVVLSIDLDSLETIDKLVKNAALN